MQIMVQNCCVPSCKSKKLKGTTQISFFHFPRIDGMKEKWLAAINRNESGLIKNKHIRVCSQHFLPSDFISGGNVKKLKARAIPSLNIDVRDKDVIKDTNMEPFHCIQCPYECEWHFQLDSHKKRGHPLICQPPYFNCAQQNVEQQECELCVIKKETRFEVYEHFRRAHAGMIKLRQSRLYSCEHCTFSTASAFVLLQHTLIGKHRTTPIDPAVRSERFMYHCPECEYRSRRPCNVRLHLVNACLNRLLVGNSEEGWFSCTKCGYRSDSKSDIKQHLLVHMVLVRVKPSGMCQCIKCPYETSSKPLLIEHYKAEHSNEAIRWYQCYYCSYCTEHLVHFNKHKMTCVTRHVKVRKYTCTKCSFSTTANSSYGQHLAWHRRQDVEMKCAKCSFTSTSIDRWNAHQLFCVNRNNTIDVNGSNNIFGHI